ncbi:MAG: hypothetical protein GWN99_20040 [Gemmatimonadetes bacterium]|uniref:Lipocalin-like domain-containing protein n=1 Tax=Candidatus Kutchimonas denitrificans TaxID=3056748 RepID=A0AAE4ZD08_9BACT|nr:hypothetical protein [Gemmatimonadota bacterium]NIR76496.1 hypothetical protein [Candidatus Kutchimonas denitrificans]NIS03314.1 hypothetical protein [Gemmatimonadota bacterium]NIT69175.1 hypothetical protein [Gemmatimonadota bacterium]NIU54567.1 hypothetical protein [Gemmatimonadota bacterium]
MIQRASPHPIAAGLILMIGALTGCGDDPLTIEGLAGEYIMIAAEGQALPAVVQTSDTLDIHVTGGNLLLLPNAQYSFTVDYRLIDPRMPGNPTTEGFIDVGPWEIANDRLLFQSTTPGRIWIGTVDGSRVSIGISEPDFLEKPIEIEFRREAAVDGS